MVHTVAYFSLKASWWLSCVSAQNNIKPDIASGINAYAHHQSSMYTQLAHLCATRWRQILLVNLLEDPWCDEFYDVSELVASETVLEFESDKDGDYMQDFTFSSDLDE